MRTRFTSCIACLRHRGCGGPARRSGCRRAQPSWSLGSPPAASWRSSSRSRTPAASKGVAALLPGRTTARREASGRAYYNCIGAAAWAPLPALEVAEGAGASVSRRPGRSTPTANLAAARLWFFSGSRDRTVERPVVEAAAQFYALFGAQNIPIHSRPAGPRDGDGERRHGAAARAEPPFINDCDYDAAGALLAQLLGALKPAAGEGERAPGQLRPEGVRRRRRRMRSAWRTRGYAYAPRGLRERGAAGCTLHFTAAAQSAEAVGERFVREAGYNRWADTNHLIVPLSADHRRAGRYSGGTRATSTTRGLLGLVGAIPERSTRRRRRRRRSARCWRDGRAPRRAALIARGARS